MSSSPSPVTPCNPYVTWLTISSWFSGITVNVVSSIDVSAFSLFTTVHITISISHSFVNFIVFKNLLFSIFSSVLSPFIVMYALLISNALGISIFTTASLSITPLFFIVAVKSTLFLFTNDDAVWLPFRFTSIVVFDCNICLFTTFELYVSSPTFAFATTLTSLFVMSNGNSSTLNR